jgi:hypothetical protein
MAKHRMPSKPSTLTRAAGGGLVVGGMALGTVALSTAAAPAEANAACGSGISAFSPTGTGDPQNFNIGSGNNINFQPSFFGPSTFAGGQKSSTGNTDQTNTLNGTSCAALPSVNPFALPNASFFSPTGTGNPQNFNLLSGNNVNIQVSPFSNTFLGGQHSSTGNTDQTNFGNITSVIG